MEQTSDYQMIYLNNNSISYPSISFRKNQRDENSYKEIQEPYVLVYDDSGQIVRLGNKVQVWGELKYFESERNPGGFSQKAYYQARRISAYLWSSKMQRADGKVYQCRDFLNRLRLRWKELLLEAVGEEDGGILCAMILGDKREIDTEMKELYQVNGIGHIMAKKCTN